MKTYKVHRLVAIAFISNPDDKPEVDHIDENKTNDNVNNLRWATDRGNKQNIGITRYNTSGFKGVSYQKLSKKYKATIKIAGKQKHLGYFKTAEDASKAYERKVKVINGEYYYKNK